MSRLPRCTPFLWNIWLQQYQNQQQQQRQKQLLNLPLFVVARPGQSVLLQSPTWDTFSFSFANRGPFLKEWQQNITRRHLEAGVPWSTYTDLTKQQKRSNPFLEANTWKFLLGVAVVSFFCWMRQRRFPGFFFYRETI